MMRWRRQWPLWIGAVIAAGTTLAVVPARAHKPNVKAGQAKYQQFCVSCHGTSGKGDGPQASFLGVKPVDFADAKLMKSLKDEDLFKAIKEGGPAVGKSPLMPPSAGILSDQDIRNIVAYIRTLANPANK
ncbi:MAG: c-type cytochrome [Nitrospinota bacterium]